MEAAPLPALCLTNTNELQTVPETHPPRLLTPQNALSEEEATAWLFILLPTSTGSTPRAELIGLACKSVHPIGWGFSVLGETRSPGPNHPRTTGNSSHTSKPGEGTAAPNSHDGKTHRVTFFLCF